VRDVEGLEHLLDDLGLELLALVRDEVVRLAVATRGRLERERGLTRPSEVTKPILERYQRWLFHRRKANGEPLSFQSQHDRISAVRSFFKHLARSNRILSNPASELELPRIPRRLPKHVLSVSEAERVLAQPDLDDPLGVRDRAIMETLYSTGIRRKEVAALAVFDVDADRGVVMVRQGKGGKERMVPIGERALGWIEKYRTQVRPQHATEPDPGTLFLTAWGEPLALMSLTDLVRRYVSRADIGKQGGCHLFRHTMATLMLEGGADVRHIQEMLGHASLETTQIYTQVSIRNLKAIHTATRRPRRTTARSLDAEPPSREVQ
jgi:integrase/recombinase XerD